MKTKGEKFHKKIKARNILTRVFSFFKKRIDALSAGR